LVTKKKVGRFFKEELFLNAKKVIPTRTGLLSHL
jgi:hypothetical protein